MGRIYRIWICPAITNGKGRGALTRVTDTWLSFRVEDLKHMIIFYDDGERGKEEEANDFAKENLQDFLHAPDCFLIKIGIIYIH